MLPLRSFALDELGGQQGQVKYPPETVAMELEALFWIADSNPSDQDSNEGKQWDWFRTSKRAARMAM
ncbi:hypothetical protein PspLS_01679 [Pyricularia sp. CBS 133598]|nr:hypothetical protein PspLS_01679 [Pyricularia sp. CBS 133598]